MSDNNDLLNYVGIEAYKQSVDTQITIGVAKEILKTINIEETHFENNIEYSTEFFILSKEELKVISEHLRRIHALTDNYFIQENISKIKNILFKNC